MLSSLWPPLRDSWKSGHYVALHIFRILIPIVILVKILEESGLIPWLALPMSPIMELVGLPPEFGLAWASCMLVNIYSGLSVLLTLLPQISSVTAAQMTVFAVLALIAHSLILEIRIAGQCGVSMLFQLALRLITSVLAAFMLHVILDGFGLLQEQAVVLLHIDSSPDLGEWVVQQSITLAEIYVIICAVMLFQKILDALRIPRFVAWFLGPVLRLLGISSNAVSIVLIGFTMGIIYGSGILIQRARCGELSRRDVLCSISLLGMCHSLIEDTLVLALLGGSLWGLLGFRILFTLVSGSLINIFYPALKRFALPRTAGAIR